MASCRQLGVRKKETVWVIGAVSEAATKVIFAQNDMVLSFGSIDIAFQALQPLPSPRPRALSYATARAEK